MKVGLSASQTEEEEALLEYVGVIVSLLLQLVPRFLLEPTAAGSVHVCACCFLVTCAPKCPKPCFVLLLLVGQ